MKKIILNKLEVRNFKGAINKVIEFFNETTLFGDNATCKTTMGADAIYWLLFGKNSADETKFNVKTLDLNGVRIPDVETSVKGWFTINGTQEVFERILVEKWVKQHGQTEKEYTGDETKYFITAAPKQKKDFDLEVGNLISTGLFKLLSNPLEFNRLPWERRREALIQMAGKIEVEPTDQNLLKIVNSGKPLETYKAELKGKIKLHNDSLEMIPSRIDENQRNKPEVLNWNELNIDLKAKNLRIELIGQLIQNEAAKQAETNDKAKEVQKLIGQKQIELQTLENELTLESNKGVIQAKNDKKQLESDLQTLNDSFAKNSEFINSSKINLEKLEIEKVILLKQYAEIKARVFEFDESKSICPTCKQSLPESDIEETKTKLLGNFNQTKAIDTENNMVNGKAKAKAIAELEAKIKDAQAAIDLINKELPELQTKFDSIVIVEKPVDFLMEKQWNDIYNEIEVLKAKISTPDVINSNAELLIEKAGLSESIKDIEKQLGKKEEIEKADLRIKELQKQQIELSQLIADLQKEENAVLAFEKTKMNMLEEKVNSMFKLVKFRMFEPQKNGGEKPDCVTLIDGVPYSDANTASKINAGVDIINVLSEHYQIFVPVIVDNKESVTELLPVKSQIINLHKTIGVYKLTTSEIDSLTQQIEYYKGNEFKVSQLKAKLNALL